jgi:hypothetical protein
MKTAVDELIDKIELQIELQKEKEKVERKFVNVNIWGLYEFVIFDMLKKEKKQIIEAYLQGYRDGVQLPNPNNDYYNQTYNVD